MSFVITFVAGLWMYWINIFVRLKWTKPHGEMWSAHFDPDTLMQARQGWAGVSSVKISFLKPETQSMLKAESLIRSVLKLLTHSYYWRMLVLKTLTLLIAVGGLGQVLGVPAVKDFYSDRWDVISKVKPVIYEACLEQDSHSQHRGRHVSWGQWGVGCQWSRGQLASHVGQAQWTRPWICRFILSPISKLFQLQSTGIAIELKAYVHG